MVHKGMAARGRPRKFDTDTVMEQVRDTFWRYGYAGTSMDQLAAATGLHKPSLYGAFGDKKQLYLAALDNYLADVRADFAEAFALPHMWDCLQALSRKSIDKFMCCSGSGSGMGCFMMNTAMPEAIQDPEISRVVRGSMEALEQATVRRLHQAKEEGELAEAADPDELAMILVAKHYEIAARARAGYSREELREVADRALDLVTRLGGIRPPAAANAAGAA
jgi:TetR/AcrR family transcriptional regulator, copper-responsive repressor